MSTQEFIYDSLRVYSPGFTIDRYVTMSRSICIEYGRIMHRAWCYGFQIEPACVVSYNTPLAFFTGLDLGGAHVLREVKARAVAHYNALTALDVLNPVVAHPHPVLAWRTQLIVLGAAAAVAALNLPLEDVELRELGAVLYNYESNDNGEPVGFDVLGNILFGGRNMEATHARHLSDRVLAEYRRRKLTCLLD